ncbi:hypothetical protein O3P69_012103 [Scylla paramamosain]|uniref:Uncharacterized protein n=1 Tax=Scylla paramamosain TaxID=85552 RepID=A0AAW0TCP5_SCYPA
MASIGTPSPPSPWFHMYPLAALAEKVGGEHFRRFVIFLQNLAIFAAAVPFLLLASETLQRLVADLAGVRWSVCEWLFVTTALMTPLLCLGTPKDLSSDLHQPSARNEGGEKSLYCPPFPAPLVLFGLLLWGGSYAGKGARGRWRKGEQRGGRGNKDGGEE